MPKAISGKISGHLQGVVIACLISVAEWALGGPNPLADEIREAALAKGGGERPLPLAAHWHTGVTTPGFGPSFQIELLDQGYHVLPWFALPTPDGRSPGLPYYERLIQKAAEGKLPLSFVSTQWERLLSVEDRYKAPTIDNPNVVKQDGTVEAKVSPFGSPVPWREVGREWGSHPLLTELARLYPDPPLILMISNNEHAKLRWKDASNDRRFKSVLTKNPTPEETVSFFAEAWRVRYGELFNGIREGLAPGWQRSSVMMGYNAFLPASMGRWPGWVEHSLTLSDTPSAWATIWEGASLPYYTHHWDASTDFRVWSPQVEAMNWRAAIERLPKERPFWIELSTWDGNRRKPDDKRLQYEKWQQKYGPARYEGMVQYGLWLIQPRTLREFRGHTDRREDYEPYFRAALRSVERIHRNPDLRTFWQRGRIMALPSPPHPYQTDVPPILADTPRWFGLPTSSDPPLPWKLETEFPVFALGFEMGEKPSRSWLVYAHAPLGMQRQVTITIPGVTGLEVDVPTAGGFWVIEESPASIRAIDMKQAAEMPSP